MTGVIAHVGLLVASMQAGPLCRAAGNYFLDQHAVIGGEAHLLGEVRTDGIRNDAQRRPPHLSVSCEIGEHGLCRIDGNREADAGALLRAVGSDHGVDADDFAARVQQRPAGVAGIDGRIGLNRIFDRRAVSAPNRADGTDDAAWSWSR